MQLQWNEAQRDILAKASEFANQTVRPAAASRDTDKGFPHDELLALAKMGFMGINVAREHGGLASGVLAYSGAISAIGAADASVGVTMSVNNMVCEVLEQFGTPEQKKTFIPRITSGEYGGGSFCLSEPGSGSDAAGMVTRAEQQPDGSWIIDGTKSWITTGAHAGVFLVWAKAFSNEPGSEGAITAFVVDPATPGISVGKPEEKMGQHGSNTVTLSFDQVHIPQGSVLGDLGKGFRIAMVALDGGRIGVASLAVGISTEAMQEALRVLATRDDLARDPDVQSKLGELSQRLVAARQMTLHAASLKESKARFTREASMAKVFATEAASLITEELIALLGPFTLASTNSSLERLARDARVTRIYEGTSEIQRVVIARDLIKDIS